MHHHHLTSSSPVGALVLLALLAVLALTIVAGSVDRRLTGVLVPVVVAGGAFQLGHAGEHALQAGYWSAHRGEAPWMTPWASALADSFGRLAPGTPGLGMEAMHLTGNAIFLVAAIALLVFVTRTGATASRRPARIAAGVQAVHVAEHIALTATVLAGGPARGVSTLLATLQPGPVLWTYRIWWHLTINLVATAALVIAVVRAHRRAVERLPTPVPAVVG